MLIADPDPLARRAVRDALESAGGFTIVAGVDNGRDALELTLHYRPDIVVTETSLPAPDGVALTREIARHAPEVRVVLLSAIADEDVLVRAVRAGAAGYLTKDLELECLARVLRSVAFGEAALPRKLTMRLIERLRREPEVSTGLRPVRSTLTQREWEVLDLLIANASTQEIADTLVLSPATVHSHVKNIYRKLRVRSRLQAIHAAQQLLNEVTVKQATAPLPREREARTATRRRAHQPALGLDAHTLINVDGQ